MAKAKIYELTEEEENLILWPYTEYWTEHPGASHEDFVNEKYATSKGYLFAKKFNKEITPWQHFQSLSPTNRKEILDGWNAELTKNVPPTPKEKSVAEIIAEENSQSKTPSKQEPSDENREETATEQKAILIQQLESIRNFDRTETFSSVERKNQQLIAQTPAEEQNGLQLLSSGDYVQSDQIMDLLNDERIKIFLENLPEFAADFNNPELKGLEKLKMRQKLVDFVRFIESGKRSKASLEAKDWRALQLEYKKFPKMPTSIIFTLCESQMDKAPKSDRTAMMQRVVKYNFENLIKNKNEVLNEYEFKLIEDFVAKAKEKDPQFGDSLSAYVEAIKEQQKNLAAEKDKPLAKPIIAKSKQETPSAALEVKTEEVIPQKKNETPVIKQETSPIVSEKPATPETETPKKEEPIKDVKKKPTIINEAEAKSSGGNEKDENGDKDAVINDKTAPVEDIIKKKEAPAPESEKIDDKWKEEIFGEWEEWAKKSDKVVAKYENEDAKEGLSLKVFAKVEDQKNDHYEADITYASANNISVKGRDGLTPGLAIFEEIVKTAKKNGPEIEFGSITSPEFKAKLLLVCLNDPEIKVINQPQMSDLKGIPEELKKAIEDKLPKEEPKEEKKPEEKREYRKPREDRRNNEERGDNQGRPPRREYTPEETAAWEERKKRNKEKYGDERPPRRQFTAEETAAYEERKRRRDAVRN